MRPGVRRAAGGATYFTALAGLAVAFEFCSFTVTLWVFVVVCLAVGAAMIIAFDPYGEQEGLCLGFGLAAAAAAVATVLLRKAGVEISAGALAVAALCYLSLPAGAVLVVLGTRFHDRRAVLTS